MTAETVIAPGRAFRHVGNELAHVIAVSEDGDALIVTYWRWSASKRRRVYDADTLGDLLYIAKPA